MHAQGGYVAKRTPRPRPAQPAREKELPVWPAESHSGEGSASALEMLQKLERHRVASRPADLRPEDDPPPER